VGATQSAAWARRCPGPDVEGGRPASVAGRSSPGGRAIRGPGLSPTPMANGCGASIMGSMRTPSAPALVGRERELGLVRGVLERSLGSAAVAVVRETREPASRRCSRRALNLAAVRRSVLRATLAGAFPRRGRRVRRSFDRAASTQKSKPILGQIWKTQLDVAPNDLQSEDRDTREFPAPPAGFEPATCGLEVRCSIQLSYGGSRDSVRARGSRTRGRRRGRRPIGDRAGRPHPRSAGPHGNLPESGEAQLPRARPRSGSRCPRRHSL
jgi:hypothetical protein